MAIIQCKNGHRYDSAKFKECPFCKAESAAVNEESKDDFGHLGASIGLMESTIDRRPVVGWIVCVDGPEKGRDYRIRAGKNKVGRSWKMDISIAKDRELMPSDHAVISFSSESCSFQLEPGVPEAESFKNGKPLTQAVFIEENDRIKFGESEFVFVPYCKQGRLWED